MRLCDVPMMLPPHLGSVGLGWYEVQVRRLLYSQQEPQEVVPVHAEEVCYRLPTYVGYWVQHYLLCIRAGSVKYRHQFPHRSLPHPPAVFRRCEVEVEEQLGFLLAAEDHQGLTIATKMRGEYVHPVGDVF